MRTYSELSKLQTFDERFEYLRLFSEVGGETFGSRRYFNQRFYRSKEWKQVRDIVIARDEGCDLGIEGYEIYEKPVIHHMNPFLIEDLEFNLNLLLDPEFLITTTYKTHNAIHYGIDSSGPPRPLIAERSPDDTKLW